MRVIRKIEELRELKVTALSIGNYDGIHLGHQAIIKRLTHSPKSLIVTFDPHPSEILSTLRDEGNGEPQELVGALTAIDEKISIIEELGVENLFILQFTPELANMSAEDFIKWLVIDYVKPKKIVIGYNHRFGQNGAGDFELLVRIGTKVGIEVIRVPPVYLEGFPISSSWVRRALINGEVELANKLLGRPYSIVAQVITGDKRGAMLSYPTANLQVLGKKLIPKNGVYAVRVEYKQEKFDGMMNIGESPTFGKPFGIEVHIFDFDTNLVNEDIKVEVIKYIRETQEFKDLEAIKNQLKKDEKIARQLLLNF